MNGWVRFSCVLPVSFFLIGSSAFAQRGGVTTNASPSLTMLMQENEKKLSEMESIMNKLDAAQVLMEEDMKSLEKAVGEYIEGMDRAFDARDTKTREAIAKDLKEFEDRAKAFEDKLRRIDLLHTTIAEKVQNATLRLDEAWLNKMTREERLSYVKSLKPEG